MDNLIAQQSELDRMWADACAFILESDAAEIEALCDQLEADHPILSAKEFECVCHLAVLALREAGTRIASRSK